ncbi:MAG TPA: glycoside hydrolase family 2 TIM barrel-domain containing protein [Thermoanaerobaculia bacterium]
MNALRLAGFSCAVLILTLAASALAAPPADVTTMKLDRGWAIQSTAVATAGGAEISRAEFDDAGWYPTPVPTTVLAALVRNEAVPDPFEGRNLETIGRDRFLVPWWFRKELTLDAVPADARLRFEGINYSADVWLNGEKVAGRETIAGAFRVFELDVTRLVRAGTNVLAVEVVPPQPADPTIGFVDWNPPSPDRYLGLWREVALRMTAGVSLDDVWVRGDVDPKNLGEGRVTVSAKLTNRTDRAVTTTVRGAITPHGSITFERRFRLAPRETREIAFTPADTPKLKLASPKLWWPVNLGDPDLYYLNLEAVVRGAISDRFETQFGIRRIEDYVNAQGHRGYRINGKPVLIRGGGWADDLLLVEDEQRLEDQLRYVRHMNLNTIRLEGFWGSTHGLYDLADRHGVMIWAGWSCLWEWDSYFGQKTDPKYGGIDTPEEIELIAASWRDQVIRLRNHPSVIVWNLASDLLPRPELETRYRADLAAIDPTRPPLVSCGAKTSEVSGPSRVKMEGPYEWEPPNYWYAKEAPGGAFGFNTETGPGAQPPVAASIRRMLPEASWWPIDAMWAYHSARGKFANLDRYVAALDARYGPSSGLDEFALKAQMANYEAMRGMFEAFSLRRPVATGVIQWMLNGAWPKMFWQLYDYYLVPTGAFYAVRNSGRPVHVALDLGTRAVVAVNDSRAPLDATATVRVFDEASRVTLDGTRRVTIPAGGRDPVLVLPESLGEGIHFVDARVVADDGSVVASNFYWLPATPDVLDWEKSDWFVTPVKQFADLKGVSALPKADLAVAHRFVPNGKDTDVEVTLGNPGPNLAFFVEMEVAGKKSGRLAAPVFWDDNYVSLAPGETRTIRARIPAHGLGGEEPVLRWRSMNAGASR